MTFLKINNITKNFGTTEAVTNFNLEIEKGELVSFLGPSGCGKTTTLRMVAGFEMPTGGRIVINGVDVTDTSPNQRDIGMVFQSYALFPNMTVAGNIGFGLKIAKKTPEEINQRVVELLELINLPDSGNSYPYELSGGMQQRVALARALALRPEVLLLDEPLSALDAKIRVSLRSEIRSIQQKLGITAIYVTHDQEEALSISDRVVVMNKGQMEQVGTPFEIYNFPKTAFVASFVGTLNTAKTEVIDPEKGLISMMGIQLKITDSIAGKVKGDVVMVAIRPERISFASEGKKENILDAKVENVTFLGSVVRIQLTIGDAKFNMDTFNRPSLELPSVGDKIQVTCSHKAVLVLNH